MKKVFFTIIAINLLLSASYSKNYIERDGLKYFPNKIIIKFTDEYSADRFGEQSLVKVFKSGEAISIRSVKKKFSAKKRTAERFNLIREIEISGPQDPMYLSQKLNKLSYIEWAEPVYIHDLAFTPNDQRYNEQYAPQIVQAPAAWDVTKGSNEVVIAIVDTGIDWDHPDLAANIWINTAEANGSPGVDDDNNGFIDDIRGWDFGGLDGTPDNNPMEDRPDHGTHVAGIASASTNNGIGVAGIGFNCKIMAVKTSQDDVRGDFSAALISYGYLGIIYAVDNGADVINCSWGSYGFQQAAQEVISYAVANGVTVIGAAGNEGRREAIYPGKYEGALTVGYSNASDSKDVSSNYGEFVDLFAPGSSILNTWQNDTYVTISGSSMAAPLVAGIAGLVKSVFPNYTSLQVAEQVRVNSDNIDALNPGYPLLLGAGRANAFKAVSNSNAVSVRATDIRFIDKGDGDGVFESGERIEIEVDFTNYLSPTNSLNIQISSASDQITFENTTLNAGSKSTLESFNNMLNKFAFKINQNAETSLDVIFRIDYSDGSYSDFQWTKEITINPLYKTTSINDIAVTISSDGKIGYNDYPTNLQGDGFVFRDGTNILFEGGLMYGTSSSKIISSVRSSNQNLSSDEFSVVTPFLISNPGTIADEQGHTIFNEAVPGAKRLNIETELNTYSFADDEEIDFIILEYSFKNTSSSAINGLYAGLFFDWDIDGTYFGTNKGYYDETGKFGYVANENLSDINTHVAAALLTEGTDGFYTISNPDLIYDGFTDSEKWTTLTNGTLNATGGPADISSVSSVGPLSLPGSGNIKVAFSLAAAESIEGLRDAVNRSRNKYNEIVTDVENEFVTPLTFNLGQNYPNPFNPTTTIEYSVPSHTSGVEGTNISLIVYDVLGRQVETLANKQQSPGTYKVKFNASKLSSGVYYYTLTIGSLTSTRKMILLK